MVPQPMQRVEEELEGAVCGGQLLEEPDALVGRPRPGLDDDDRCFLERLRRDRGDVAQERVVPVVLHQLETTHPAVDGAEQSQRMAFEEVARVAMGPAVRRGGTVTPTSHRPLLPAGGGDATRL